jgi:SAM-dependent methyltransferase
MPTIQQNRAAWDGDYDWSQAGDEWSARWGGTESIWWNVLYPRIHAFIPAGSILEIGPGYGRFTQYLRTFCDQLYLVDLSKTCIDACRRRFADSTNIVYHLNDGRSLAMIPDESLDFVFSFDSLVHAEADVMEAYLRQLATKLTIRGIGFIHHSNLGAYARSLAVFRRTVAVLPRPLRARALLRANPHWRAESMTASQFETDGSAAGLVTVGQELINWRRRIVLLSDCFSVFTRKDSVWSRPNRVLVNRHFIREALYGRDMSTLYTFADGPSAAR